MTLGQHHNDPLASTHDTLQVTTVSHLCNVRLKVFVDGSTTSQLYSSK